MKLALARSEDERVLDRGSAPIFSVGEAETLHLLDDAAPHARLSDLVLNELSQDDSALSVDDELDLDAPLQTSSALKRSLIAVLVCAHPAHDRAANLPTGEASTSDDGLTYNDRWTLRLTRWDTADRASLTSGANTRSELVTPLLSETASGMGAELAPVELAESSSSAHPGDDSSTSHARGSILPLKLAERLL